MEILEYIIGVLFGSLIIAVVIGSFLRHLRRTQTRPVGLEDTQEWSDRNAQD